MCILSLAGLLLQCSAYLSFVLCLPVSKGNRVAVLLSQAGFDMQISIVLAPLPFSAIVGFYSVFRRSVSLLPLVLLLGSRLLLSLWVQWRRCFLSQLLLGVFSVVCVSV
jgi:hypothetical protein